MLLCIKSMSWVPGGFRALSGGCCTEGELKKKGAEEEKWSGDEARVYEILYLKTSFFLFPAFTLCLLNEF